MNEIGMNFVEQLSFCKWPYQSLCPTKNTQKVCSQVGTNWKWVVNDLGIWLSIQPLYSLQWVYSDTQHSFKLDDHIFIVLQRILKMSVFMLSVVRYAACRYAHCRYVGCRYAECRGVFSIKGVCKQLEDFLVSRLLLFPTIFRLGRKFFTNTLA